MTAVNTGLVALQMLKKVFTFCSLLSTGASSGPCILIREASKARQKTSRKTLTKLPHCMCESLHQHVLTTDCTVEGFGITFTLTQLLEKSLDT